MSMHMSRKMINVKEKELDNFTTRSRGWLGITPNKNEKENQK